MRPARDAAACRLVAARPIPAGRTLLSVPTHLSLSASAAADARGAFSERWAPLEELSATVARQLHDKRSTLGPYIEFLYDMYNADAEETEYLVDGPRAQALQRQLDSMYAGNLLSAQAVGNAPFLSKDSFTSPEMRVEWTRLQRLARRLEQSVPHFAAKSTQWALSVVLARAIEDDQQGLSLFPFIDMCEHSFTPNASLHVATSEMENRACGLRWIDHGVPHAHLRAIRDIRAGDTITRLYSPRRAATLVDAEHWLLRWGFVPQED
ncbi:hypothetical protein STCU_07018 [Strigomonas culicis]|uniref:SET domain-containing protein n=1 Tax=Strigomonas culicis TaxID=28005 RepID=S9VND3_9TRYP|nr:hypothetical protein STCU_07018 [Strigomonas culicis]|eukprot:EPY24760.1 hypothetical protein STCU_07018 [Strigomonas culicis]